MKKLSSNILAAIPPRITAGVLIALAVGLALSAPIVETPFNPDRKECKNWPCDPKSDGCGAIQDSVKGVFQGVMNEASKGTPAAKALRAQLLDQRHGWGQAWRILHDRLAQQVPQAKELGPEHTIIFYEDEDPIPEPSPSPCVNGPYAENHCLHILYLPEEQTGPQIQTRNASFDNHLMCCYIPWAPQLKAEKKEPARKN
jgi:hypothetical protein